MSFLVEDEPVNFGITQDIASKTGTVTFDYEFGTCLFEIKPTSSGLSEGLFTITNNEAIIGYKTVPFKTGKINVMKLKSKEEEIVSHYIVELTKEQGLDLKTIFKKPSV
ncbi:uncharacterized protein LOC131952058 [Physella acuta]|uniref:uncharacterized protein LOC131952058 n=1 Tax=Physella acuta TaxID=109671 RepID=UPI0027DB42F1|nr:uncharacterized protein LOC131952058 [Physella acuta]